MMIAAGILAVPIVILIALDRLGARHAFFELQPKPGGERVVVRGGRASLWNGKVLADTGLTRAMVAPEAWKRIDGSRPRRRARRLGRLISK